MNVVDHVIPLAQTVWQTRKLAVNVAGVFLLGNVTVASKPVKYFL